jgi:hypothetical protein
MGDFKVNQRMVDVLFNATEPLQWNERKKSRQNLYT